MEKKLTLDERTMRKYKTQNEALKAFLKAGYRQRNVLRLFAQTWSISVNRLAVNLSSLDSVDVETQKKIVEKLFGRNETSVKTFDKKVAEWRSKFDDKKPIPPIKKGEIAEKA
jgi:hypothetical protein